MIYVLGHQQCCNNLAKIIVRYRYVWILYPFLENRNYTVKRTYILVFYQFLVIVYLRQIIVNVDKYFMNLIWILLNIIVLNTNEQ